MIFAMKTQEEQHRSNEKNIYNTSHLDDDDDLKKPTYISASTKKKHNIKRHTTATDLHNDK